MNKMVIPVAAIIVVVLLIFIFKPQKAEGPTKDSKSIEQSNDQDNSGDKMDTTNYSFPGVLSDDQIINKKAIITTDKGVIEIELYGDKAPKTVSNFVYLVNNNFYNGLTFHRVEPKFVIQGGDPKGDGTGGPGYKFEDETVQGEYEKGSVAMANSGSNTNGSQFFICLDDLPDLPKKYNLFGKVIQGLDIVDKISIVDVMNTIVIEPAV